jgi:hypothetical protein
MYASECICTCVCMHVRMHMCVYACTNAYTYVCGCTATEVCMYASECICMCVCMHVCMPRNVYAHVCVCMYVCTCVWMHVRMHTPLVCARMGVYACMNVYTDQLLGLSQVLHLRKRRGNEKNGQTSTFELFNDRHNPGAPWPSPPPKPLAALRLLGDGAWASAHNYLASAQSRCE